MLHLEKALCRNKDPAHWGKKKNPTKYVVINIWRRFTLTFPVSLFSQEVTFMLSPATLLIAVGRVLRRGGIALARVSPIIAPLLVTHVVIVSVKR